MDYFDSVEEEIELKLMQIMNERKKIIQMGYVNMLDENAALKSLFVGNVLKAKYRNQNLLRDIEAIQEDPDLKIDNNSREEKKLSMLKKNYWSMVKSVYPVWLNELEEYKKKKNLAQDFNKQKKITIQNEYSTKPNSALN